MELAPRYCRSCGSRILVKNVCHNCNNDPLKGDNYCYDCGSLTPNADGCLRCGAKYKRTLPVKPVLIIGSILIIAIALTAYFVSRPDTPTNEQQSITQTTGPESNGKDAVNAPDTIVNNPLPPDTSQLPPKLPDTTVIKPDSTKQFIPQVFAPVERAAYKIKCSYFEKKQKSQVLFFIGGGNGYIKVNGSIYELKRKRKGVDLAVFSGNEYEATIVIDGLSGNSSEWLASCTLIIKDLAQNASTRHKVYSSCIEL